MSMIERRSILKCLAGVIAAPAIIKVAGIMPVKASLQPRMYHHGTWEYNPQTQLWSEILDPQRMFSYNTRANIEFEPLQPREPWIAATVDNKLFIYVPRHVVPRRFWAAA